MRRHRRGRIRPMMDSSSATVRFHSIAVQYTIESKPSETVINHRQIEEGENFEFFNFRLLSLFSSFSTNNNNKQKNDTKSAIVPVSFFK
jgi:hypothetical protein